MYHHTHNSTLHTCLYPPHLSLPSQSGGLNSFMHLFLLEALAVARAHVAALGGNALLSYRLNECVLIEHPHKNQVSGFASLGWK